MTPLRTLALLLAVVGAGPLGCKGDCAGVGAPAVDVTVVDAETGTSIAAGATLYLFRTGQAVRADSVTGGPRSMTLLAGWDDEGQFDVVVERPGYFPWTANGVRVDGDCTTETAFLTARLRPRPST